MGKPFYKESLKKSRCEAAIILTCPIWEYHSVKSMWEGNYIRILYVEKPLHRGLFYGGAII